MCFVSKCSYPDYREPPWVEESRRYKFTSYYWRLLAVRLSFVVIFENVIATITSLMRWIIPDVPQQLRQQMRQHAYLTNELILQQEYNRAKEMSNETNLTGRARSGKTSTGGGKHSASTTKTGTSNPGIEGSPTTSKPSLTTPSYAAINLGEFAPSPEAVALYEDSVSLPNTIDSNASLGEANQFYAVDLAESTSQDPLINDKS